MHAQVRQPPTPWLHGVFVGDWLFVFPLCGFSLSLFCNHLPRPDIQIDLDPTPTVSSLFSRSLLAQAPMLFGQPGMHLSRDVGACPDEAYS